MALKLHVEPVNGGLVNARDPSLLQPGELQQADNAFYKPNSQALHKAPSRSDFATNLGGAVTGLRFCAFDFVSVKMVVTNGTTALVPSGTGDLRGVSTGAKVFGEGIPVNATVTVNSTVSATLSANATATGVFDLLFQADNLLVAQANSKYQKAIAADSGTVSFSDIEAVSAGDSVEAVHMNNRHVVMNGVNANRVLLSNGTMRAHGLKPQTATPNVQVTTSGAWSVVTGAGFYSYWTTEYDKLNDVESDFTGKPAIANVDTVAKKVIITQPPRVNETATHWRVYRSVKMSSTTQEGADNEGVFPDGFRVGELELKDDGTQSTMEDGGSISSSSARNPTALGTVGTINGVTWVNATNSLNATTGTLATLTYAGTKAIDVLLELGTFGFTVSGLTPPISGITVVVRGSKTGNGQLSVVPAVSGLAGALNPDAYTARKTVPLTTSLSNITLGNSTDLWLRPGADFTWTPDLFADGKFYLRLYGTVRAVTDVVSVDTVTVTVSYGKGQQLSNTIIFPSVVVSPFGIRVAVGRNGLPPRATTGDVFEGSLVTNDVSDESLIRYSYPDTIDYFPSVYFLNFDTKDQDRVTCIRSVGQVLGVGLSSQIYRVNHLPREVDAEFDRGRAKELFETSHGIAGPMAAAVFSMPDGTQMMAYASYYGLHLTNLYSTRPLSSDLNFEQLLSSADMSKSLMINNPRYHELQFFYVPKGSVTPTVLTKMLRFSYHPSHIKSDGSLKCSGPCDVNARSAALATLRTGSRPLFTGHGTNGTVSLENQGSVATMTMKTRQMYLAGTGSDWNHLGAFMHYTLYDFSAASPCNLQSALIVDKTGASTRLSSAKTIAVLAYPSDGSAYPRDSKMIKAIHNESGEGIAEQVTVSNATVGLAIDHLTLRYIAQDLA